MLSESKPVSLITGGTGGLGRVILKRLVSEGHMIILNYRSSVSHAEGMKNEIGNHGHVFKADVSSSNDVKRMAKFVNETFGKLDNLINNAGMTRDGLLVNYSENDWNDVVATNLKGCFNCIQAMVPLMERAKGGHIVNISSYSGIKGKTGQSAYSASKAGLIGMSIALATELSQLNIRVNTVLPGFMETSMGINAIKAMEVAKRESLLNTLSEPEEVAGFIAYLCSTRKITGQVFSIDSRIL